MEEASRPGSAVGHHDGNASSDGLVGGPSQPGASSAASPRLEHNGTLSSGRGVGDHDDDNVDGLSGECLTLQVAQNTWINADLLRNQTLMNQVYVRPSRKLNNHRQQSTQGGALPQPIIDDGSSSSSLSTPDACESPIAPKEENETSRTRIKASRRSSIKVGDDDDDSSSNSGFSSHSLEDLEKTPRQQGAASQVPKRRRVVWVEYVKSHEACVSDEVDVDGGEISSTKSADGGGGSRRPGGGGGGGELVHELESGGKPGRIGEAGGTHRARQRSPCLYENDLDCPILLRELKI